MNEREKEELRVLLNNIIEAFGYWNEIDEEVARYIKEKAKEKVNGDLLDGVVLYG